MDSIAEIVLTFLAMAVLLIFVGSLYAFGVAIYTFVFSNGDADKIKQAWNSIRYMIFGIVLTLTLLFLFPVVLKRMKVQGYDYYSAQNIFKKMSELTSGVLNLGREAASEYNNTGRVTISPVPGTVVEKDPNPADMDPLPNYDDLEL